MAHIDCSTDSPHLVKPVVVGIYAVPGSGKTFLFQKLREHLGVQDFNYFESSEVISGLIPGGLDSFRKMDEGEKTHWRERAIDKIAEDSALSGRVGVVAGHYQFWNPEDKVGQIVWTEHDAEVFTHILYLDIPARTVAEYRLGDLKRARAFCSEEHLQKWQDAERDQLRLLCLEKGILFSNVPPSKVATFLRDIRLHNEDHNLSCAQKRLDQAISQSSPPSQLETVTVFDCDRTLIAEDTGALFWRLALAEQTLDGERDSPLKKIFGGPLGYSYAAFRQAAMLYEEIEELRFESVCEKVASAVTIYPEMLSLLNRAVEREVTVIAVTCGLQCIWEKIFAGAGFSEAVKVIGGGRIADGLVVTPEIKSALVAQLKQQHKSFVCAFGDSVLDLPMLKEADRAIVVVGEESTRSGRMERVLEHAIDHQGLRAEQVVLPIHTTPRLDAVKLPLVNITDRGFLDSILSHRSRSLQVLHATGQGAAKILMTPMRDSAVSGPSLQEAHAEVGKYLALQFLSQLLGTEEYTTRHVQGHNTKGYRVKHEGKTTIVALMRGGEPMARGVNKVLSAAMSLHAKSPDDLEGRHLEGQETVILVDSVINSGKSVAEFIQHIRSREANIRIVVVTGVIQAGSLIKGPLQSLSPVTNLAFVSLRLSENRFTGSKGTDTGNRLFNTTKFQ
ncbi:hypothetical protein D9757_013532 [Collybiopsis confluens]|uniref:Phosphoribosyltransferase domain-containing protein n=1 Tax=Collybiopsis confluens TaxID=2823264 RepID=A0A8H5FW07_9AGAR|nr:hypothetical protein D9757_013532 [Collybiopsis confluens]